MLQRLLVFLCLLVPVYSAVPRPLADLPIRTPDNKTISLKPYRDKVLILVLISTSCEDCLKTLEIMNKIQREYAARGLQVVGAAINDNAAFSITPFVQRYRPAFPVGYLDREDAIKLAAIPPNTRPFVPIVLFTDHGIVRVQYYGDDPIFKQQEKAFRAITDSLLKFAATHSK